MSENFGWIPISQELPQRKDPHEYSKEFLVTVEPLDQDPFMTYLWFFFEDGKWYEDKFVQHPSRYEVLAWQPRIFPYEP